MVMANGFNEMNISEQQDVNGGSILVTIAACAILGLTVAPYAVCAGVIVKEAATAIDNSFDDERAHAERDAVSDARRDYEMGYTTAP